MKRIFYLFSALLILMGSLNAQSLNTTLRGRVQYNQSLNDIWGYVAPDGTEYALVGLRNGVSIVSLADPDNPVEVASIPGQSSTWRDLKTYGEYAYITTDQGGSTEGITIIDLTDLPNDVTFTQGPREVPGAGTFSKAHNIFIDQATGLAYIAGANTNGGGMIIYDVATEPGTAIFRALAPSTYAHDVFVQDGLMYASEINVGELSIYDVSDVDNITKLSNTETPFDFTHNAWTTADGNYVFTTDERSNAPVGAYDITDPEAPVFLDEFRPGRSLGSGVIPHNVHVIDEYLSISYYTDGLVIADASVPDNIVEVAYYDTWQGADGGFNGSWGAYPFLPSGLSLATDIDNGLFVIDVDYKRAARIRGTITDADSGVPLNDVRITISSEETGPSFTDAAGKYATGLANAGEYTVTISKLNYAPVIVTVDMINGEEIVLDTSLAFNLVNVSGNVVAASDQSGLDGARVVLEDVLGVGSYNFTADGTGNLNIGQISSGTYNVYAAKWGFQNVQLPAMEISAGENIVIELEAGILDGFILDQGWASTDEGASTGFWERGRPVGTVYQGQPSNPGEDVDSDRDLGNQAYVTGNGGGGGGTDDIDDGLVILTSPVFDGTQMFEPEMSFHYWFFNDGGTPPSNDYLKVEVSNGNETVELANYTDNTSAWVPVTFMLEEFITLTDNMRVIFTSEDQPDTGHIVEAGIDDFAIISGEPSSTENNSIAGLTAEVYPNPSRVAFNVNYSLSTTPTTSLILEITDQLGRTVEKQNLPLLSTATLTTGSHLPAGAYFARLIVDGKVGYVTKLVKK